LLTEEYSKEIQRRIVRATYLTVWKDLEKQEYQHSNQDGHNRSDGEGSGNVHYASDTRTLKKQDRDRLLAFAMK